MALEIARYEDAAAFVAELEAENNLLLGMLGTLRDDASWVTPSNAHFGIGREGDAIRGVSMWTSGYRMVLSFPDDEEFGGALGIRIGGVYTPPHFRRHGYASACVAALSQRLLLEGRQFCFLFTDARNPTSNAIYQRIGYEPVGAMRELRFDEALAR